MYITVLDFTEGRVFQYDVTVDEDNGWLDHPNASESIESFLIGEGHRLTDCEWMSHADGEIITDKAEI
tara:strand:+ start:185 stop:388 length:204 start_codon:yes stop_codon:yes gene_type:complete